MTFIIPSRFSYIPHRALRSWNPLPYLRASPRSKSFFVHIWIMSDSQEPWSSNPNAPNIPYSSYFPEKANFAGTFVGLILYGTSETPHLDVRPSYLICSRDRHSTIFPMYDRAVQPRQSQRGEYQMGTRIIHRRNVLECHHFHRDEPQHSFRFLR